MVIQTMKRTEIERKERELKRMEKKILRINKTKEKGFSEGESITVGTCINKLFDCFMYDENEIYNLNNNEDILELLLVMEKEYERKTIDGIIRKAIKKTKIGKKEEAFKAIKELLS